MKKLYIKCFNSIGLVAILMAMFMIVSCKQEHLTMTTTSDVNITGYFEAHPEQFSEFQKVLERSGTASFLGAYGKYTVFAPTNDAIKSYLQTLGKSSVDQVDAAALKDLVRLHTILDTVSTAYFKDGKLQQLTMYGQYLLTGAAFTGGVTKYTINRQANVLQANVRTGNGIIHVLDKVLVPASKTLAQLLEADPNYAIFTEALKATRFFDTLNVLPANAVDTNKRFLTVIAESDAVLRAAGFNSYAQLKQRYSTKNDPTNHADSLWLFVAYHISPAARYLADIVTASSHPTLAPQEIITSKLSGQNVLINDDSFNGVYEPGYIIDRAASDNTAQNGVLHAVSKNYAIKVRNPTPIYWDIADQPELMKLPNFRKLGGPAVSIGIKESILSGVILGSPSAIVASTYDNTSASEFYANNDRLSLAMGSNRHAWIQFTTPMIIKGAYKVWICYRTGNLPNIQATIDAGTPAEQVLPNILVLNNTLSSPGIPLADPNSDNLLEAAGYKRYSGNAPVTENKYIGRLMGSMQINTTDKHTIRLTSVGGRAGSATIDMIHFIPVTMDQQYPRINRDGTQLPRP